MERDEVERAQKGDRDAFASLVHQVGDGLFAVAHRILRDTDLAEDALQVPGVVDRATSTWAIATPDARCPAYQ